MKLVCFDTQVMIWGIKGEATPGQEDMISKSQYLIKKCDDEKIQVLIPSIVVAELLSGTKPEKHKDIFQVIQKRFIVQPFDARCSVQYAKIWQAKKRVSQELKEEGATRAEIKADCMIIATTVVNQAVCIYTHDRPLRRLAQGFVDARDLPEIPPQVSQLSF
ncbi:MAG: PIN domain-containing protein [Anaerolineae bacterium]|nr:PIN domain-containing protein [Anaerolineae bacterium]